MFDNRDKDGGGSSKGFSTVVQFVILAMAFFFLCWFIVLTSDFINGDYTRSRRIEKAAVEACVVFADAAAACFRYVVVKAKAETSRIEKNSQQSKRSMR